MRLIIINKQYLNYIFKYLGLYSTPKLENKLDFIIKLRFMSQIKYILVDIINSEENIGIKKF